jgi:hypothetical protein
MESMYKRTSTLEDLVNSLVMVTIDRKGYPINEKMTPRLRIQITNEEDNDHHVEFRRQVDKHVFQVRTNSSGNIIEDGRYNNAVSSMFVSPTELVEQLKSFRNTRCEVVIEYVAKYDKLDIYNHNFQEKNWFDLKGFIGPSRDIVANSVPVGWQFDIEIEPNSTTIAQRVGCHAG